MRHKLAAMQITLENMSEKTVGFAIIGCGAIGPWHASAIAHAPGARLVAVADAQRERAQNLVAAHRAETRELGQSETAPAVYTNPKSLLKRDDVDVVCICVPSGAHAAVGIEVARAGKHIVTEKPLEITLEKIDALLAATRENNVKLAAIFQRRFFDNAQRIKAEIERGKLGKILQCDCEVKSYRSQAYYDSGDWRGTWALDGGGCLMNQGVHGVDLMQWFGGPVAWVQAWCGTTARKNIEVETQAMAILGFKNGAHGTLQGSTVCYPGEPVTNQIYGSKGSASLRDTELGNWKFLKETAADKTMMETANDLPQTNFHGASHLPQIVDMVECVRTGKEPACSGDDARHAVEIILAIYESARRGGEKIDLPLEKDFPARGFPK